jgi:hypothetical protein
LGDVAVVTARGVEPRLSPACARRGAPETARERASRDDISPSRVAGSGSRREPGKRRVTRH